MDICAKSGTAEVGADQTPNAWFTGFFAMKRPRCIIVLVENGGGGSSVAGTVASQVLQAAVGRAY